MNKPTAITFSDISPPKSGVVVVLAEEGPRLSPAAESLDQHSNGAISRAIKVDQFKGKKKSMLDLLAPGGLELSRLLMVGVGKLTDYTEEDWRSLGGLIRSKLSARISDQATIIIEGAEDTTVSGNQAAEFALGAFLRDYKFDKYKTEQGKKKNDSEEEEANSNNKKNLSKIIIQCADFETARKAFTARKAVGEGVVIARDLVNEPANILGPSEFAERMKELEKLGVDVQILDEKTLQDLGMNALLAVGQASVRPTYLVVMKWQGGKKDAKPVAILGKGVCFDTGGLSLKPAAGMEDMKGDMAGAACVAGLMHALAARKAKVNAVGVIGLVENMPSGNALRPGDVIKAMSGQTIEVLNTDAEGRLVLADALWYAQTEFDPVAVINLATLTGAILVALGKEHAGLFSNNDELSDKLTAAGRVTGEKVWRLPLDPKYDKLIDSEVADMKNIGGRLGGSITAAQFLQRFIKDDVPWAHLDIAGTGMAAPKGDINQSWGSGYGVRLLNRLIADNYEG